MAEKKTADVLRLQANVPETIALKFTDGLAVGSKYPGGDQVMFSLCDGRRTFLPALVAKKIADAGIEPNQPFTICKCEITEGNRRRVEYQVEAITVEPPPPPAPAPARSTRAVTPISNVMPISNGNGNGNGHNGHVTAAAPDTSDLSTVEFMKLAGRGAIDAVVETEKYAKTRGLGDFVFDSLSVQKIMVSLYIDLRKGGRA